VWSNEIKSLTWKNPFVLFTVNQIAIWTNAQHLITHI